MSTVVTHRSRRREILAKHPEISQLYGTEPLTFFIVVLLFLGQIWVAKSAHQLSPWQFWAAAYIIGGPISHALQLSMHELCHDLCWGGACKYVLNRATAVFANLATGVPSSQTFKVYHMEHHSATGVDGVDTDLPSEVERRLVTTSFRKVLWLAAMPLNYGLRPLLIRPKRPTAWEIVNFFAQMTFDVALVHTFGASALMYLLASTLLGMGLHPVAGHFVAEHFELAPSFGTYSYYGPCNWVNFNVGYHVEHHDFPRIPWSRLPRLREIAPEFYDTLPSSSSYIKDVFLPFIFNPNVTLHCRVRTSQQQASQQPAT
jgi:sphingolipid delta-4 desaturase